jgi:hypothetical protein
VNKMGTDWFVKVQCPHPNKDARNEEEHIKARSGCPFVIWKKPENVAGFMSSMCGVRVGGMGMAAESDNVGEKVTGISCFTKEESGPLTKIDVLQKIEDYTRNNRWNMAGFSQKETREQIDSLIESCKRAEKKELAIYASKYMSLAGLSAIMTLICSLVIPKASRARIKIRIPSMVFTCRV